MSRSLEIGHDEIRRYCDDGIICLRRAFPDDWVEALRQAAEDSMQDPGELHAELAEQCREKGRFFHDTFIWQRNATCRRFVFESAAASIASRLMRSHKINIFFDQWLIKEPGTETATPWHNDMPYWPVDGRQICSIWVALDPVRAESGAVEYVRGSHHWAEKYKPASFSGGDQYREDLPPVPDIEGNRDRYDIASRLPGARFAGQHNVNAPAARLRFKVDGRRCRVLSAGRDTGDAAVAGHRSGRAIGF
jgi:ectoine hydroxylase-related dioxygenase (phytanoyl-CoA dioxygenase family)